MVTTTVGVVVVVVVVVKVIAYLQSLRLHLVSCGNLGSKTQNPLRDAYGISFTKSFAECRNF